MFLTEFFTILVILAAVFVGYKYRHLILKWLNERPQSSVITKRGVTKDLDVLMRYNVNDAIDKIVAEERVWAEAEANLGKQLRNMKDEVKKKYTEISKDKPETPA